ncbi:MAG: hypothetical protein Q8M76_18080, partial [Spirochaetaceae bacterium]|nr:hypothetical protein [Spirochaetaceae bacterium]
MVDAFAGDEFGEDDVDAVVAAGEVVEGADAGAADAAAEVVAEFAVGIERGDFFEEADGFGDSECAEVLGLEETEEGRGAAGDAVEEALSGGDDREDGMILEERAPGFLAVVAEGIEELVQVFDEDEEGAGGEVGEEEFAEAIGGGGLGEFVEGIEGGEGELGGIFFLQRAIDAEEEVEEGGAGFVF